MQWENGANNVRCRRSNQKLVEEKINRREKPRRTKIREKNSRRKQMEEMRQELQNSSRIMGEDSNKDLKWKIPKLVISWFNGTHIDYFRFWNQFEAQIYKSELSSVMMLSYLKEMIIPKVRLLIDGLPRNTEVHERAKIILSLKFGKPSELANAHVQNIYHCQNYRNKSSSNQ